MHEERRRPASQRQKLRTPICVAFLLLMLTAGVAHSHDIWLHADRFRLDVGDTLVVRQLLGEELDTDLSRPEASPDAGHDVAADDDTDDGPVDLLAALPSFRERPTVLPVIERAVDFEGLALVTMEHYPLYTEFTNEEFFEYLDHEGFDREKYRQDMGSREAQAEAYVRTLKCLVQVGESDPDAAQSQLHSRVLGQRIEIVLLQNPYSLDPGDELELRVLAHGEPVQDQLVNAYNAAPGREVSRQLAHTDATGKAVFTLDGAGLWLIRLVNLTSCSGRTDGECEDADWDSAWAAYSFELD